MLEDRIMDESGVVVGLFSAGTVRLGGDRCLAKRKRAQQDNRFARLDSHALESTTRTSLRALHPLLHLPFFPDLTFSSEHPLESQANARLARSGT